MDRILKAHFDSFRSRSEIPPELSELNEGVKLFEDIELLESWRNWRGKLRWEDEQGNLIRGAVDDLLQLGDKLIVLDYKTRGYPLKEDTSDHYQHQLDLYNLLLRKNGYQTEDYGYLIFYHPSKVDAKGHIVFNTDLVRLETSIKNAEALIVRALNVLEGDIPDASDNCGFCNWLEQCKNVAETSD